MERTQRELTAMVRLEARSADWFHAFAAGHDSSQQAERLEEARRELTRAERARKKRESKDRKRNS